MTTADSQVRIGLILPDVMGTYGDDGNALVLRQRLRMRGYGAEIVRITLDSEVPDSCDVYTLGGGEDSAQMLASRHLRKSRGLQRAATKGVPIVAICAGLQVLGERYQVTDGSFADGLGLLDVRTESQAVRSIGEVASTPQVDFLSQPLLGFENHMGATTLGPDAQPLGRVTRGVGNSVPAGQRLPSPEEGVLTEGVVQGSVIATYMHGPALARNPELADHLLARALGADELDPLVLDEVELLRAERSA